MGVSKVRYLIVLILSLISGYLYHLGGIGKPFSPKIRDVGCSIILLYCIWVLKGFYFTFFWVYLATFLLTWVALSTYWDWLFKEDNFYMHGLMCGLSLVPFVFCGFSLFYIITRGVLCGLLMGLWSKSQTNPTREEFGRGAILCLAWI